MLIEKYFYYYGVVDSPDSINIPKFMPFELVFEEYSGTIIQNVSEEIEDLNSQVYKIGSSLSTPLGTGSFGNNKALDIINFIEKRLPNNCFTNLKVLEIGCGNGFLLDEIKKRGAALCIGFEPDPSYNRTLNLEGVNIIKDFFNPQHITEKFDLVLTYGVLEHIKNPVEFIGNIEMVSEEGAVIFNSVPNCELGLQLGDISFLVHEHYNYFTRNSLNNIFALLGNKDVEFGNSSTGWMLYSIYVYKKSKQQGDNLIAINADDKALFNAYVEKFNTCYSKIQKLINENESAGLSIGIYGGGFSLLGLNWASNPRFFDSDISKHGKFIPGCSNAIEPPDNLITNPVDKMIITPINFDTEICNFLLENYNFKSRNIISVKSLLTN